MFGEIAKLGVAGGIGFLIGLGAMTWIQPDTTGGRLMVIVISIILAMVAGAAIKALRQPAASDDAGGNSQDPEA